MSFSPAIVPYLSYVDAKVAVTFLTEAFGLEVVSSYEGQDGRLLHGELRHGNGVVMIGSVDESSSKGSPGIYLVVDDVDAHFERAKGKGATIVYPPEDTEFGTRRYRARDPEGHEWSFGSYQPKTETESWT